MTKSSTTATTECTGCISEQVAPTPTITLQPPQPSPSKPTAPEQLECKPDQQPARPYLKLLMPEPAPDPEHDAELRRRDCKYYFLVLSRGYVNKDWKSRPAVDEEEDEEGPVSSLFGETY